MRAAVADADARLDAAEALQRSLSRLCIEADARHENDRETARAECYGAAAVRLSMVLAGEPDPVADARPA